MASELWQRLRAVRKHLKLSGEAFGAELGVSKGAVSQWEASAPSKRTLPDLTKIIEIHNKWGVPFDWLLNDQVDLEHEWWVDAAVDAAPPPSPPPLPAALPVVLDLLERADDVTRPAIQAALHRLIDDPSQLDGTLALLELLRKGAATETAAFVKPKDPA